MDSFNTEKMDSLPPNDPNNNRPNGGAKEDPYDGSNRGRGGGNNNEDGTMDIMGDMRDAPVVVAMFLVGVAAWFLRERCVC